MPNVFEAMVKNIRYEAMSKVFEAMLNVFETVLHALQATLNVGKTDCVRG